MPTLETVEDVQRLHRGHWFDAGAIRFFRTRFPDRRVYGGKYFVTSEQFVGSDGTKAPRKYSVRQVNPRTGDIETVGGAFNTYPSLKAAQGAIWALLNEEDRNV